MSTGCPSGGSEFSSQHAQGQLVTTRNSSSGETLLNLAYIHTYITLNGGGGGTFQHAQNNKMPLHICYLASTILNSWPIFPYLF